MKKLRPYQQQAIKECWDELIKNDNPVLLMASVGAGKSLMIASILLRIQKLGKRALCIVNNAELVRNNCATFKEVGGDSSIFCAALKGKDASAPVVFGTPQSILNGINKDERIAQIKFNLIVIDEAHTINFDDHHTGFMRILRHFKQNYDKMRVLGATGTNFRYKGWQIVGDNCLFKTQVGNITTVRLIKNGYLIKPKFEVDSNLVIDFSKIKLKNNGTYDTKELAEVINKSTRLTELICKQIIHIMESQNRFGVFIFATTKKHAEEILSHLPKTQSALILGNTSQGDRTRILEDARNGHIKYLVNIAIISVGIDVPSFDTIAYLRPTESLVLLIQTMGRVLRLSPGTGKTEGLVLDFAGNIERHSEWDNPILLEAIKQVDKDKPTPIICPRCSENNTECARRCIGAKDNIRCDYYFEFKECPGCNVKNDIASRYCYSCQYELIDPNKKLSLKISQDSFHQLKVMKCSYGISSSNKGFGVHCAYQCTDENGKISTYYENYYPYSYKARNIFYGQFVKRHCSKPRDWYLYLNNKRKIMEMLQSVNSPEFIVIGLSRNGYKIKRKIFNKEEYEL